MAQTLKPEMRARIHDAALRCFAEVGYRDTSMATIATAAGTAPANLYRYYDSKQHLFDDVVPAGLAVQHDALLDRRIQALATISRTEAATDLLDFWSAHRLAVVVLLDRADGTPFADYPAHFVKRLVDHAERTLPRPLAATDRTVLQIVFDNTRRAIARILASTDDAEIARRLVDRFWSYQLPGLDGLLAAIAAG